VLVFARVNLKINKWIFLASALFVGCCVGSVAADIFTPNYNLIGRMYELLMHICEMHYYQLSDFNQYQSIFINTNQ